MLRSTFWKVRAAGDGDASISITTGLPDVFLVNGTTLDGKGPGAKATSHLYRNLGNLRFEDVTAKSGLGRTGWGQGACVGDYDNDGRRDLFVTYYGHSVLYHNEGGGVFRDVTKEAGLSAVAARWDTGCTFVDYDLDGKLDLAITGYLEFDRARIPEPGANSNCQWKGMPVFCGPRVCRPGEVSCFSTREAGGLRSCRPLAGSVSRRVVTASPSRLRTSTTMVTPICMSPAIPGPACSITTSKTERVRRGRQPLSGTALNEDGQEQAGMGVAIADYDEDGYVDILKTNFSEDTPIL